MGTNWFAQKSHTVLIGLLIVLSYVLLLFGNSIVSLTHPDEVFYIQSAKEMIARNSWLTPMIFDGPHFEKPFLSFALFIAAIKVFGMTAFAGRFFPSLFGMIGVVTVYWIAWTLFKRKRIAFFSGLILTSSFIYVALSRAVLTDMIFSVFVALSIGFFSLAYYNRSYKTHGLVLWWVFAGIAVLTKGLLGILFPFAAMFIFLFYKKDFLFLRSSATIWGLLLFCAIALPWHILMYMRHGQWFLEEYFYNVHWRRILMSEHARLDNWYFYIALLFVGVMPWFLLWIPTVRCIYKQFKKKLASRDKIFFLLAWIISIYIFVQPAHSKLASYIFPAFFAAVILLAYALDELLEKAASGEQVRVLKACSYIMSGILIIVALGGIPIAKRFIDALGSMQYIYFASGLLIFVAFLISAWNWKNRYTPMVLSHLGVTFTLLATMYIARPYIEPWVSCKDISEIFKTRDLSNNPVLASKFYVRGVRYYTDREMAVIDVRGKGFWSPHPIEYLDTDHKVIIYFSRRPESWAVVKEGNVRDIQRIFKNRSEEYKVFVYEGVGGKYILKVTRKM